jgi:hypothetical protein
LGVGAAAIYNLMEDAATAKFQNPIVAGIPFTKTFRRRTISYKRKLSEMAG